MNATAQAETHDDVVTVTDTTAVCDGTHDAGGHPRVYLQIDPETGEVTCPYCSRIFRLDPNAKPAHH